MKKRILSLMLVFSILATLIVALPTTASAASGTCGDNLTWTLDNEGVLTISGEGDMWDYEYGSSPWYQYTNSIFKINICNGVTSVGKLAFCWCNKVTSIKIPNTVAKLGESAFYYCTTKAVYIDDIESWCNIEFVNLNSTPFRSPTDLYINNTLATNIKIPETVTVINEYMFYNCKSVTSIDIPSSVENITDVYNGFSCQNLTEFTVSEDNNYFSSNNGVLYNKDYSRLICCPQGKAGAYVVLDSTNAIGEYAFNNCVKLTGITIPNGVTTIEDRAFRKSGIQSIVIPDTVVKLGTGAFVFCVNLADVVLSKNITEIPSSTFSDCYKLKNIDLQQGIKTIGNVAFNCCDFTEIEIPKSVVEIQDDAFYNCSKLTDIYYAGNEFEWSCILIGTDTHRYFTNATKHYLESEVDTLSGTCGDNLFWTLDSEGVLTISGSGDMGDFLSDSMPWDSKVPWYKLKANIKKVVIGENVTSISAYAFYQCTNIEQIQWNAKNIKDFSLDNCIFYKAGHDGDGIELIFSDNVENIPNNLSNPSISSGLSPKIKSIKLGANVVTIGSNAFYGCMNIVEITIPETVEQIEDGAFWYCDGLIDVYYNGSKSEWNKIIIGENNEDLENATIHYSKSNNIINVSDIENLQSAHPYSNDEDTIWIYTHPSEADSLQVTFSDNTETESGYDYIYIYDGFDNLIGKYSGTELAGKTISISGNVIKIQLTSDSSETRNGFTVTSIDAVLLTGPITNLRCTACTKNSVTLSFPEPKEATSVTVEQSVNGKEWVTSITAEALNSSSTVTTVTGLEMETQYYFRLNVIGGEREGLSNEISARTAEINNFISQISEADTNATIIRTAEELATITEGSYVLGNDIYLENYNNGIWNPIFPTGNIVLDGQGHKIYNLNILTDCSSGLFAQSSDKIELKNLGLDYTIIDTSVCGGYAGSMIGMAGGDVKIENCFTNIEIKTITGGDNTSSGGFVGRLYDGNIEIKDSYNKGKISSTYSTGGLIGEFMGKNISLSNCYNRGEIIVDNYSESTAYAAGITGRINDATITINNCFNEGKIHALNGNCDLAGIVSWIHNSSTLVDSTYNKGEICTNEEYSDAGGLFNQIDSWEDKSETVSLKNCYNSGDITKCRHGSGLVYEIDGIHSLVIDSCYNIGDVHITEDISWDSSGLIGCISVENADINNCYNAGSIEGNGLFSRIYVENDAIIKNSYNCGNVTYDAFAFIIDNATIKECYNIGEILPSQSFISSADNSTIEKCCNSSANGGFLGSSFNSVINNCYNKGSVTNKDNVGGLVGSAHDTIIKNSYNSGNVNADDETDSNTAGGLIGYSSNVTLENCYNIGNISATSKYSSQAGGLIGHVEDSLVINNCHNKGTVNAKNAGGLIGLIYYWSTDKTRNICNSYNKGNVSGKYRAGGIIGSSGPNVCIEACYNEGTVESTTDSSFAYAGGLIGDADGYSDNLTILQSYNLGEIATYSSGDASIAGGIVGMLYGHYKIADCYNMGSVTSNDNAGGVIGRNAGTIINCNNSGNVSGLLSSGGISGVDSGTIENCYNTGKISGNDKVGGLVGTAKSNEIKASYNKGTVSGTTYTGGAVGYGSALLDDCKNIGALISNNINNLLGGLIGYIDNTLTINSECSFVGTKNAFGGKADNATITGEENIVGPSDDDSSNDYSYNSQHKYFVALYDDIAFDNDSYYKRTSETDMSFLNHTACFSDCWEGKFVFVEGKDLEGYEIGLNLLKVYPLKEYVGIVETATDDTLTLNGVIYDIGENLTYTNPDDEISIPFYDPDSYIGDYVCIRICNSKIVDISRPTWETSDDYIMRRFDKVANTINISKGYYTPETYYISPAAQITPEDINNNVGNYIHYLYDIHENRKAIYNIFEYKKPELTYYDTFKPSTWEEVEKAANDFIAASEAYKNGVIELMNSDEDEEAKKAAERRTGAQKLMEKDNNSDSYFLTFSAGTPDSVKIYAYEALYDALAKAHENSDVDLGDIKISGDIISSSTEIVKKITDAFCNLTSFTGTYDKYTVSVHMNSYGVGGALSFFGTMTMRGENGNTIDSNIVVCSKTEDIEKAYAVYFSQLKELAENSIEGAMKECVKAFTGKSIDDWGKWGLKHALKKYAPQILSKGAGDVVTAVSTGHDIYKKIKKLVKLNGATPEQKYEAVMKIDWLASMKDDKSITDKTVDSLYKALKSAATTLELHINSYKNNTEIEKKSKWNWLTSIKCPVDVYVYTKNGNEVGHIVGNDIEYSDDICLIKTGDIKKVYLPNMNDYEIKTIAANDGILNYTVEQYADGNPIGRVNFYDIAMNSGDEFISDGNISDIETEHEQVNLIKNSEVISSNEYISSDSTANVTISGTCDGNGSILGLGSYAKGDGVVLTAVPDGGYIFDGWYINGELVSTDIDYSFCATSDKSVTAKFRIMYTIDFDMDNNKININSAKSFSKVELVVAHYQEKKLLALQSKTIDIAEGENSFDSLFSDYTDTDTIKIMVWNSITGMKPLFKVCSVDLK